MDQKKHEHLKNVILEMRQRVLKALKDDRRKESLRDSSGTNSYSFHLADQGSEVNEYEKSFLLASMEGDILEELDEALDRIDDGSFGTCVICGKEINQKRLEAIPYAKLCIECKSNEEKNL